MDINPTKPQADFTLSNDKAPAFVGGFGSGKTEALIYKALLLLARYPLNSFAWYAPTYDLIRQIAWPRWEAALTELGIGHRLYKIPVNEIHIFGGGRLIFRSMDRPEGIVGFEVADSFFDELDTLKIADAEKVWNKALARNRQKKPDGSVNTMCVATTPEGFGFVYKRWVTEKIAGYEVYKAPTYSNPHVPDDYVETLRATYKSQKLIDAYIEGKFVNLTSGTVYHQYDRSTCGSSEAVQSGEPLFVGMDFNVGKMSAVVHVKRGGVSHAVGEVVDGYDTPDMIRLIKERYEGHQIIVYPDASGGGRRSVDASTTDLQLLRDAGFKVFAPRKNPPVRDRINCMNESFVKQLYKVNADLCPVYCRCLEQQAYNDNGEPDKKQDLDHLPDAGGYYIHQEHPLIKPALILNLGSVG